jgi:hypothetical protein
MNRRNAAQFGTTVGPAAIDMSAVRKRKREMVERQVAAHLQKYKESGAEFDPYGEALGYEDVFTKLEHATRHFEAIGLGKEHVKRIVR